VELLLALVLLRDVPGVQQAFESWRLKGDIGARVRLLENLTSLELWTERKNPELAALTAPGSAALMRDLFELRDVVVSLGLGRYRWLPTVLAKQFGQVALKISDPPETEWPSGLRWQRAGKRPKQRAGSMGGYRLEDLERNVTWFVHCEVLKKSKKRYAREQKTLRSNLQSAITRIRNLLDCIHPPFDNSLVS